VVKNPIVAEVSDVQPVMAEVVSSDITVTVKQKRNK
jgi:hypothetical protein